MISRIPTALLLFFGLVVASSQMVSALTVSSYGFAPESGGPGTVVHLSGTELYDDDPLTAWLVIPLGNARSGEITTKFQLISKLGVTQPDPAGGHPEATFVIPGRFPDGSPITERNLGIMLTDMNNQQLPELSIKPFEFITAPLPGTGIDTSLMWLLLFDAGVFLTLGLLIRKFAYRPKV